MHFFFFFFFAKDVFIKLRHKLKFMYTIASPRFNKVQKFDLNWMTGQIAGTQVYSKSCGKIAWMLNVMERLHGCWQITRGALIS